MTTEPLDLNPEEEEFDLEFEEAAYRSMPSIKEQLLAPDSIYFRLKRINQQATGQKESK